MFIFSRCVLTLVVMSVLGGPALGKYKSSKIYDHNHLKVVETTDIDTGLLTDVYISTDAYLVESARKQSAYMVVSCISGRVDLQYWLSKTRNITDVKGIAIVQSFLDETDIPTIEPMFLEANTQRQYFGYFKSKRTIKFIEKIAYSQVQKITVLTGDVANSEAKEEISFHFILDGLHEVLPALQECYKNQS